MTSITELGSDLEAARLSCPYSDDLPWVFVFETYNSVGDLLEFYLWMSPATALRTGSSMYDDPNTDGVSIGSQL